MKSQIQKWGNSLALRIPKAVASDIGLTKDSEVEVKAVNGKLVVTPTKTKCRLKLRDLLAKITADNLHSEVDFGSGRGDEAW